MATPKTPSVRVRVTVAGITTEVEIAGPIVTLKEGKKS